MPKPDEMGITEVFELLTGPQKQSVLARARHFAKKNVAASTNADMRIAKGGDGRNAQIPVVDRLQPVVDGLVKNPNNVNLLSPQRTSKWAESVKCAVCGILVEEKGLERHWRLLHPKSLREKAVKKSKKKGKKKGTKKGIKKEANQPKLRLVPGGLCSPR